MLELPLELEQKITEIAGADNFFTFAPAPGKKDAGCRIVRPGSVEGLSEIVRLCSAARVPMYPSGLAGFPLHSKWTSEEYLTFLQQNGWTVRKSVVLKASFPLTYTECVKSEV